VFVWHVAHCACWFRCVLLVVFSVYVNVCMYVCVARARMATCMFNAVRILSEPVFVTRFESCHTRIPAPMKLTYTDPRMHQRSAKRTHTLSSTHELTHVIRRYIIYSHVCVSVFRRKTPLRRHRWCQLKQQREI